MFLMGDFSPEWEAEIYVFPFVPRISEVAAAERFSLRMMWSPVITGNIFVLYFCLGLVNKWFHIAEMQKLTRASESIGRGRQEVQTDTNGNSKKQFPSQSRSLCPAVCPQQSPVCKLGFYFRGFEVTSNRWCFETIIILANRVTAANCPVLQAVINVLLVINNT